MVKLTRVAFFTVMTLLEGKSMSDVEKKWKSDFMPTLQTNWMVYVLSLTSPLCFYALTSVERTM